MEIRNIIKIYTQPAFLICVIILAVSASGMSLAIKHFNVYLKKEPLPLKKSLDLLDEEALSPYKVIAKQKIENKEIIKTLGTEDYIQWMIEDSEAPVESSVRSFSVFITYYSLPDRVPHVPEECYTGGGYQRIASEPVTFEIDKPDFKKDVPGRYLLFEKPGFAYGRLQFPVLYFFKVNGEYGNSREDARIALNKNLFRKSSYFCKVEIVFNRKMIMPTKEEAVKACQKFLSVLLPVLEKEHWPDWSNVK
jgi:hypothetical protein